MRFNQQYKTQNISEFKSVSTKDMKKLLIFMKKNNLDYINRKVLTPNAIVFYLNVSEFHTK